MIRYPENIVSKFWDISVSYLVLCATVVSDMGDYDALAICHARSKYDISLSILPFMT